MPSRIIVIVLIIVIKLKTTNDTALSKRRIS
jgi:hypothetical protein